MQREVNMEHPFESRLHIDYSTNNHSSHLSSASDLDGYFMGHSLMGETTWTQDYEKTLEQLS